MIENYKIAVIIPCYKVINHIEGVISSIPPYVDHVIAVDDKCPQNSGKFIEMNCKDPRITILYNNVNQGVGGAMITGYQFCLKSGIDICVKIDGDGQMDPALMKLFVDPIIRNEADYTKGNRFYWFDGLKEMPVLRLIGNSALSFINKLMSGYWEIMDPTNGYTAISSKALLHLPFDKIERRYFFESDLLFRLGLIRAIVQDVPMEAKYSDEKSNLSIINTMITFPSKYLKRIFKRIIYLYFLRDFNAGSVSLLAAIPSLFFGSIFGLYKWYDALSNAKPTPTGTLFIIALLIILGVQFLITFITYDVYNYGAHSHRARKSN